MLAAPADGPSTNPDRSTKSGCNVIGTGVQGTGTET